MTKKNNSAKKGFTLVEVIVVAVIVLIISAIAIPMYNGYINQTRQETVQNLAETAAAEANAIWRRTGSNPTNIASLNVHLNTARHSMAFVRLGGGTVDNAVRVTGLQGQTPNCDANPQVNCAIVNFRN